MSIAPSRSAAPSQNLQAQTGLSGSVVSKHSHRTSSSSHHSGAPSERPPTSVPAKSMVSSRVPTVVPADSVSQIGTRPTQARSVAPSQASHASAKPLSHLSAPSQVSGGKSNAGSQMLTEANLQAHDADPEQFVETSASPEEALEVVDEPTSHVSLRSGYRSPTIESASVVSSHRSPTILSRGSDTATPSQSGSKAPSAIPSHALSASPSTKTRSVAGTQVRSTAPISHPATEAPPALSTPPTVVPSSPGSIAPSHTPSKVPTSAPSHHSLTAPSSPASPQTPTPPSSPPTVAQSVVSREAPLVRSTSDTALSSRTSTIHVVQVERTDEQIIETDYRIHRRHVYPVAASVAETKQLTSWSIEITVK